MLGVLDILWWRNRYWTCRLVGWLRREPPHVWDTERCWPVACRFCGTTILARSARS